jgi:hypothetical protein
MFVRSAGKHAIVRGDSAVDVFSNEGALSVSGKKVTVTGNACVDTHSEGVISMSAGGITESIGGFINLG